MTAMKRTFRDRGYPWWFWRRNADRRKRRGVDPLGNWLTGLAVGQWADWNLAEGDLFQDNSGVTAATTDGNALGFIPDRAQWGEDSLTELLAGQPELVSNGGFDTNTTGWTLSGTALSVVSGKLRLTNSGASGFGFQTFTVPNANSYHRIAGEAQRLSGSGAAGIRLYNGPSLTNSWLNLATSSGLLVSDSGIAPPFGDNSAVIAAALLTAANGDTADFDNISVKEIPGYHGVQSTAGSRLALDITTGRYTAQGDGTADNALTAFLASGTANTIIIDADVPATLAATQVIAGASGSSTARIFAGFNTSGIFCGGIGGNDEATIVGSVDRRSTRFIGAITTDGVTDRLLTEDGIEYAGPTSGSPTTSIPFRLMALNNNGTAGLHAVGGFNRILVARKALDPVLWPAIRAQLLGAA